MFEQFEHIEVVDDMAVVRVKDSDLRCRAINMWLINKIDWLKKHCIEQIEGRDNVRMMYEYWYRLPKHMLWLNTISQRTDFAITRNDEPPNTD